MPVLTPEPLAFEEDWANRFAVVSSTLDPKQWIDPFYTDDAVVKRAPLPPLVGKEAIKAAVNQMCSLVASISHRNGSHIIDQEKEQIIFKTDAVMVLKADPEKREIVISYTIVSSKKLGVGEEKMHGEEVTADLTPLFDRLKELGIQLPTP